MHNPSIPGRPVTSDLASEVSVLFSRHNRSLCVHAGPSKTVNQIPGELQSALAGRYVLEGLLGAGGMAHVYRALDVRHQRRVAVKVLRADLSHVLGSDRFMQEIRTTATLQHPHILPLLDSGDAAGCLFYVMPLVVGETLRTHLDRVGTIPMAQALALVRQLAAALDYAHRHRVIHRDIKPENILMTDGLPLLADFGIALGLQQAEDSRLTQTGFSLGTPQYMSPEQVLGAREIDGRSDQYSLACVLFEAISGQPPFRGGTGQATMMEHVLGKLPPLTSPQGLVPAHVQDACRRALDKEAGRRFATMSEFAAALDHPAPPASRQEDASIVVLPFENLSSDPENAFFADGLTEEIIADLSKVRSLRVISRSSAMSMKGAQRAIPDVCRDLQVRYALEGSVRRAGDHLRITAQLVDGRSDTHLWGEKYSGTSSDIFELQERLSREIVAALRITLTPEEEKHLAARDISDVRVFEVCALARQEILRVTPDGLRRAHKLIEDAIAHFGRSAPLLAVLANVHWNYVNWGIDVDESHVDRARELAGEALAIDPENAGAHYTLSFIKGSRREVRSAIEHARRALRRDASNPDLLLILTLCCVGLGQIDEALTYGRQAADIDPLTPMSRFAAALPLLVSGRPAEAFELFELASQLTTGASPFHMFSGLSLFYAGRRDESIQKFELASRVEGHLGTLAMLLGAGVAGAPNGMSAATAAVKAWASHDWQYSWHMAQAYALNGMPDDAMWWLTNAVEWGLENHALLATYDRSLDSLRGRKDFDEVLQRVRSRTQATA